MKNVDRDKLLHQTIRIAPPTLAHSTVADDPNDSPEPQNKVRLFLTEKLKYFNNQNF